MGGRYGIHPFYQFVPNALAQYVWLITESHEVSVKKRKICGMNEHDICNMHMVVHGPLK